MDNQTRLSPLFGRKILGFLISGNWMYLGIISLCLVYAFIAPNFLSLQNLDNILATASVTGIAVAGWTICLASGQIDASIVGASGMLSVIAGVLFERVHVPFPLVLVIIVGVAGLCGLINSIFILEGRIFSFVATTATSGVFLAIGMLVGQNKIVYINTPGFAEVILSRPLGIPVSTWMLIFTYVVLYTLLNHTKLGAHIYATGANRSAARLAGVSDKRVIRICLIIVAIVVAMAALIVTARNRQTAMFGVTATAISNINDVFLGALLGGASLYGGVARLEMNLVAVIFLAIMSNGLLLMTLPPHWLVTLKGIIFVFALTLDTLRHRIKLNK